jgi:hypothetical protein
MTSSVTTYFWSLSIPHSPTLSFGIHHGLHQTKHVLSHFEFALQTLVRARLDYGSSIAQNTYAMRFTKAENIKQNIACVNSKIM